MGVPGIRMTDSAQTLEHVFGHRNMKKTVILGSKTPKTQVMAIFCFILKKSLEKKPLKTVTI